MCIKYFRHGKITCRLHYLNIGVEIGKKKSSAKIICTRNADVNRVKANLSLCVNTMTTSRIPSHCRLLPHPYLLPFRIICFDAV